MKHLFIVFWSITAISLFFFTEIGYKYHFYYIEQLQLFLFIKGYAIHVVSTPGGLSDYLARFLIQFFVIPGMGALITTLLLLSIAMFFQTILRKCIPVKNTYWLSILPALSFLPLQIDPDYKMQGTVAFLLMMVSLFCYVRITKYLLRFLIGILLVLFLFWASGPVGCLFAVGALLWETNRREKRWLLALFFPLEFLFLSWFSLQLGWQSDSSKILTPLSFYDSLRIPLHLYCPWLAFVFAWALCLFYKPGAGENSLSFRREAISLSIQILPLFLLLIWISFHENTLRKMRMEQDYYLRTSRWDRIIERFSLPESNHQTKAVFNLALAQKALLGEKLFSYKPEGVTSLLPQWDHTLNSSITLSDIYYHIGDLATSQKFAFEGFVSSIQDGSPRLLKRLVETNLIFGSYPVAEKYIAILEQTLFYRPWARNHRKYLYDNNRVMQDSLLGAKRKALMGEGSYAVSSVVPQTLEQLAVNYPANQLPIQYLSSLYLLNRDRKSFRALLEKRYGTQVWPRLSTLCQEAVLTLERDNPRYGLQHGASLKVEQHFKDFNRDLARKRSYYHFREEMEASYGDTYWFYLVFDK